MPIIARQALLQAATGPQYHPSPARHWNAGTAPAARRDAAAPRDDAKRREQTITRGRRARRLVLRAREVHERREAKGLLPGEAPPQGRTQGVAVAAQRLAQERGRARRVRGRRAAVPGSDVALGSGARPSRPLAPAPALAEVPARVSLN